MEKGKEELFWEASVEDVKKGYIEEKTVICALFVKMSLKREEYIM